MSEIVDNSGRLRPAGNKQSQVRDELLALLDELAVGDAIPPERRLASDLGVSRPTLRAVIDELVREGLLRRRHGSGTYVSEPKIALPLTMTSFTEDMARRGMRAGSRVLSFEPISAGAKLGQRLRVSPVDEVWAIRRLRLADDETMAIEFLHVPRRLLPDLTREDLEEHSFYTLLQERHGIVIASGTQTIEPTVLNEEEAEMLAVPIHSPAFLFERTTESEGGEVVEYVRSLYRGDRYRLVTELRPPLR
jgi:GntR family transcriptional regulator